MKTLKTTTASVALALAAWLPGASHAAGVEVLNEGFDDVTLLSKWAQVNMSSPAGSGWFQGNPLIFHAQGGDTTSYIATNFLAAQNGMGNADSWLITPALTLSGPTLLTFFTRAAHEPGFADQLEVRFSAGSGLDTSGFTTVLGSIGANGYPHDWTQFSTSFDFSGTGRFAFRYLGDASTLNYIGIDSVRVVTAVPEPSSLLMLGLGLGLLPFARRKSSK